ncbi:hypothetical protein [Psychrobacter sp. 16-MNA-CIBAN-0192]|uniref:hypothetical protein n=1 Tax=Psychrobacter sp. 16-MNA-CIBAN-0192 TaxID=3140448 RepID=UPI0033165151
MKNRILPLSLVIGAALTLPSLAMAAPAKPKPVTAKTVAAKAVAADNTIQTDIDNTDGKLASIKSSAVEISETKTFSRSRVNNNLGQQPMTTEIKAPNGQEPMTTEIKAPAEALQDQELQTTEIISEDPVLDAPEDSEEDL